MGKEFLAATRKGVFHVVRSAGGWDVARVMFAGQNAPLVHAGKAAWYAALGHGHFGVKLHRSTDRGETWKEIATPALPKREGPPETDMFGRVLADTVQIVWSFADASEDGRELWCGTSPAALFHSKDGGDSWQLVESLWNDPKRKNWMGGGLDNAGIHSICVDPRDRRRVLLAISCGGVWQTLDAGATWECFGTGLRNAYMPPEQAYDMNSQDPHLMVQSPSNPDVLWIQHHNGIFVSTDGAKNWAELKAEPSNFGFVVAVHPREPLTAWFVPAQEDVARIPVRGELVVTRTRDGGKTFTQHRNGLPQNHAYDIVFRHALDVDNTGETLVFGSTTGSIWASEDAGENWTLARTHLPPVYCVRFV